MKLNSLDIELALCRWYDTRRNFIVPNVYFSLGFLYELDLLIVSSSNYCTELEIKTSISDLKAEKKKRSWAHKDGRIRYFYFAIPLELLDKALPLIPETTGIITIDEFCRVNLKRRTVINRKAKKLTDKEMIKLGKLASMRMWNLKFQIKNKLKENRYAKKEK